MHHADTIEVTDDEGRFMLYVQTDEGKFLRINIHNCDLDTFYDQVKARIGPYLREKEEAFAEFKRMRAAGAFACDPDESGGYDTSDPKHPDFHSIHADIWDARAGK